MALCIWFVGIAVVIAGHMIREGLRDIARALAPTKDT
jgi:hypothetical protein